MLRTVSTKDIQRNYRQIFDEVKKSQKPIVVLKNNEPDVVVVTINQWEEMQQKIAEAKQKDTLKAIAQSLKSSGVSLSELLDSAKGVRREIAEEQYGKEFVQSLY